MEGELIDPASYRMLSSGLHYQNNYCIEFYCQNHEKEILQEELCKAYKHPFSYQRLTVGKWSVFGGLALPVPSRLAKGTQLSFPVSDSSGYFPAQECDVRWTTPDNPAVRPGGFQG